MAIVTITLTRTTNAMAAMIPCVISTQLMLTTDSSFGTTVVMLVDVPFVTDGAIVSVSILWAVAIIAASMLRNILIESIPDITGIIARIAEVIALLMTLILLTMKLMNSMRLIVRRLTVLRGKLTLRMLLPLLWRIILFLAVRFS